MKAERDSEEDNQQRFLIQHKTPDDRRETHTRDARLLDRSVLNRAALTGATNYAAQID